MKKIAILQSNYIPWKGYFDLIASVDEFILYDEVQFTRRDWRNRNQIKTPQGLQWITVPVRVKGKFHQSIRETEIDGSQWMETHWKSLCQNYRRSPHFLEISGLLEPLYRGECPIRLSDLNKRFIDTVCSYLGIETLITNASDYKLVEGRTERLVDLCLQAGGTEYVSGPAAKSYLDESCFLRNDVKVTWFQYAGYPEYPQLWGDFSHTVTILDLLFNCGKEAPNFMKHVNR